MRRAAQRVGSKAQVSASNAPATAYKKDSANSASRRNATHIVQGANNSNRDSFSRMRVAHHGSTVLGVDIGQRNVGHGCELNP